MPTVILQFFEGGSQKFWTISSSGKSHTVVYGRIGSSGRQVTKNFGSAKEAQRSYDRLIESKLSQGYTYDGRKGVRNLLLSSWGGREAGPSFPVQIARWFARSNVHCQRGARVARSGGVSITRLLFAAG